MPQAIASSATNPNGSYRDGTTTASDDRYSSRRRPGSTNPSKRARPSRPSREASSSSCAAYVPRPRIRRRTHGSDRATRGTARSSVCTPFSCSRRPANSSVGRALRAGTPDGRNAPRSTWFGIVSTSPSSTPKTPVTSPRMWDEQVMIRSTSSTNHRSTPWTNRWTGPSTRPACRPCSVAWTVATAGAPTRSRMASAAGATSQSWRWTTSGCRSVRSAEARCRRPRFRAIDQGIRSRKAMLGGTD
jgi:hypothetical protein